MTERRAVTISDRKTLFLGSSTRFLTIKSGNLSTFLSSIFSLSHTNVSWYRLCHCLTVFHAFPSDNFGLHSLSVYWYKNDEYNMPLHYSFCFIILNVVFLFLFAFILMAGIFLFSLRSVSFVFISFLFHFDNSNSKL